MKRILLICAAGISTSLLTKEMNELIEKNGYDYEVIPCPISEVAVKGEDADLLLLSPQVRFNYVKMTKVFSNKTIIKINNEDYDCRNAKKILDDLKKY